MWTKRENVGRGKNVKPKFMTYETMDWEAEAKRLALAFKVEGRCKFTDEGEGKNLTPYSGTSACMTGELEIGVAYECFDGCFRCFMVSENYRSEYAMIRLDWDGNILEAINNCKHSLSFFLARALFYLDLLTPEAEVALNTSISSHEKLEWTLERERLKQEDL